MNLKDILMVSRPVFWLVFPLIFYMGLLYSGSSFSLEAALLMISLSFPVCFAGYGINDVYDYETDSKNRRKGGRHGFLVKDKEELKVIKKLVPVSISPFVISLIITRNLYTISIGLVFIIVGYIYSAPPIRLKTIPILDSLSNGLIYSLLPFALGFSLSGGFENFPFYKMSWVYISMCMGHAVATIPDYEADKESGIKTFSILIGRRNTALLALMAFSAGLVLFQFSPIIQVFILFCSFMTLLVFFNPRYSGLVLELIVVGAFLTSFLLLGIHLWS